MKRVSIIGSHGLYANYGGWDQLVKNLAEKKSSDVCYTIFNSKESPKNITPPPSVKVLRIELKASGFQGLFYDFYSILKSFLKSDTILLLGVQGIPIIPILRFFKNFSVVSNVGGIEWERPKFGLFAKLYLRFCFKLSFRYSNHIILDNEFYKSFAPKKSKANIEIIPYGGIIDFSKDIDDEIISKYPFINSDYFLSISRSLEDNHLDEICECFTQSHNHLVLISNFSSSIYGKKVYAKFSRHKNITLINGLYNKPELDLIRRKCKGYIHTHSLCGTAPSLVEMIIAQKPIISIDNPQNRYTLHNQAYFFSSFSEIGTIINSKNSLAEFIPSIEICNFYLWDRIVKDYENLY